MDEQIDYPLPDPAWDYYLPWHALHRAKTLIDQNLKYMQTCENHNYESDQLVREVINEAIAALKQCLPPPPDEPT